MGLSISDETILVTGGNGFLGRYIRRQLRLDYPTADIVALSSSDWNLKHEVDCVRQITRITPSVIIHAAAKVGGIGANQANPAAFMDDNLRMGMNLLRAVADNSAALARLRLFILIGTTCSYPVDAPCPIVEESLDNGMPEPTNAPYGLAKRVLIHLMRAYTRQCGIKSCTAMLANLYGAGDNFDPETSHVIPAIIRKINDARLGGKKQITAWGTGMATRDFLHVEDAARGIVTLMSEALSSETAMSDMVLNFGSGREVSIQDTVAAIARCMNWSGEVVWDTTKPDGQPRRVLDIERAKRWIGWTPKQEFETGLREMIKTFELDELDL